MKLFSKLVVACSILVLAACDSDNNNRMSNTPAPSILKLQLLHGSPDAPAVNVIVGGTQVLSNVDYKTGSQQLSLAEGMYTVQVDGILPGGNAAVIRPVALDLVGDTPH